MVVELAAVGAVESVVEVVPPVTFAARATHDRGDTDRRRSDDVSARLRDDADSLRDLAQRGPERRAEPRDVLNRLRVVDREPPTDIERIEGAELFLPGRRHQLRAGMNRLDMLRRVHCLRADMKRQAANFDADLRGHSREPQQILRIATELARQIAHGPGAAE